ncbi:2og-Fe oxygenase family protein [Thozetella sp. PMI_491]|nr:2og-Fe oxygenase family protein [Thozetella sp. PMI_491]
MAVDNAAPFVIPTIDIAPYLKDPNSPESAKIIEDVHRACLTTGFFSLVGHEISRELRDRVFKAMEALFALPLEEKKKLRSPVLVTRGYELIASQILQEGTLPDLKEGYYIGRNIPNDSELAKKRPKLNGENIFPESIPDEVLKQPAETYYEEVIELGRKIFEILAKGMPYGDDIFDEYLSGNCVCALRFLHYPPQLDQDERQLGAGAHTDFGAITILMQDSSGGLEVLNEQTGEFVPVDPNPDAFVVNIGDMLRFWTKDEFKSNTHRVINKSNKDRYSVPLFFDGNLDAMLAPFDKSNPAEGKIFSVEEWLMKRLTQSFRPRTEGAVVGY